MKKYHLAIALLLTVSTIFLTGCPHKEYTLTMSTKGNVMTRKLTVKFIKMGGEDELKTSNRITKLYKHDPIINKADEEITFEAEFKGKTPNDIGGNGSIVHDSCQYGSITGYVENFGGSDDLAEQVKTRTDAANELINIFRLTLKRKFADVDEFAKLDKFIDIQLRKDSKTILILVWMGQNELAEAKPGFPESSDDSEKIDAPPVQEQTIGARIIQFILGHNYLSRHKSIFILEDLIASNSSQEILYAELLGYVLENKVGLKKDGPLSVAVVEFLSKKEKCSKAFLETAKSTEGFQEFKKQRSREQSKQAGESIKITPSSTAEKSKKNLADSVNPDSDIVQEYTDKLLESTLPWSLDVSDGFTASLRVPRKPISHE